MEKINIKKAELLGKLKHNLELHKIVYKEAMEAFRKKYVSKLNEMISDVTSDKFEFCISLQQPANHEGDYKDAIKMVEMDCREIIIVSSNEFKNYILNKWDWIKQFRASYTSNVYGYTGYSGPTGYSGYAKEYFGEDEDEG